MATLDRHRVLNFPPLYDFETNKNRLLLKLATRGTLDDLAGGTHGSNSRHPQKPWPIQQIQKGKKMKQCEKNHNCNCTGKPGCALADKPAAPEPGAPFVPPSHNFQPAKPGPVAQFVGRAEGPKVNPQAAMAALAWLEFSRQQIRGQTLKTVFQAGFDAGAKGGTFSASISDPERDYIIDALKTALKPFLEAFKAYAKGEHVAMHSNNNLQNDAKTLLDLIKSTT